MEKVSYPAKLLCRRCGKAMTLADAANEVRRLSVYCAKCGAIVAERMENRPVPAVRVVRVRVTDRQVVEYRGTIPLAVIEGREVISDNYERI